MNYDSFEIRKGEAWSWGAGTSGQLGIGTFEDSSRPQSINSLRGCVIKEVGCGGSHVILVLDSGEVLTWGSGDFAIGQGDVRVNPCPQLVISLHRIPISSVGAGWSHSAFLSVAGRLYMCGGNSFGQLGLGDFIDRTLPCIVDALEGVSQVACGLRHTLALLEGNARFELFGWGSTKRSQVHSWDCSHFEPGKTAGRTSSKIQTNTWKLCVPAKLNINGVPGVHKLLANGDHSGIISDERRLYLWGRGYGGDSDISIPSLASTPFLCLQVALGWNHGLALSEMGEVWAWGSNRYGQLGSIVDERTEPPPPSLPGRTDARSMETQQQPQSKGHVLEDIPITSPQFGGTAARSGVDSATIPASQSSRKGHDLRESLVNTENSCAMVNLQLVKVEALQGMQVCWIAAGSEHSAAVLDNGDVFTWGWGEHGQLGNGTVIDQHLPGRVSFQKNVDPMGYSGDTKNRRFLEHYENDEEIRRRVFCGSGFCILVENL